MWSSLDNFILKKMQHIYFLIQSFPVPSTLGNAQFSQAWTSLQAGHFYSQPLGTIALQMEQHLKQLRDGSNWSCLVENQWFSPLYMYSSGVTVFFPATLRYRCRKPGSQALYNQHSGTIWRAQNIASNIPMEFQRPKASSYQQWDWSPRSDPLHHLDFEPRSLW